MALLDRTAPRDLAAEFPARLSLTPKSTLAGQLDGAWWPCSRDLNAELPPLVAALDEVWGRITRVTVNPTHWPVIPHKVPVSGHTIHVGWFTEQHPDKLILLSLTLGRWDLLVIPPETEPAAAARLMAAAAIPGSVLTADMLMANLGSRRRNMHVALRAPDRAPGPPRTREHMAVRSMATLILIAAMIVITAIGMRLIHLLNAQHDARIAAYHFGDALPGVGDAARKHGPWANGDPGR